MIISKGVTQEADGSWWYQTPKGQRRQVFVRLCENCNAQFVGSPGKVGSFCSPECNLRPCARCGKLFGSKFNRRKFCSDACRVGPATCEECGASFQASRHTAMRFCSKKCWGDARLPVGTKRVNGDGYVRIKISAERGTRGWRDRWLPEHRFVMQQHLGRPLEVYEQVHHKNGVRGDNRLENLELWDRSQPAGIRVVDFHCPGCSCS